MYLLVWEREDKEKTTSQTVSVSREMHSWCPILEKLQGTESFQKYKVVCLSLKAASRNCTSSEVSSWKQSASKSSLVLNTVEPYLKIKNIQIYVFKGKLYFPFSILSIWDAYTLSYSGFSLMSLQETNWISKDEDLAEKVAWRISFSWNIWKSLTWKIWFIWWHQLEALRTITYSQNNEVKHQHKYFKSNKFCI